MRARTYDPATAQFLTRNPWVGLTGEPYSYVSDNPLTFADPTGRCSVWCVVGVIAGGVAVATGVGEVVAGGAILGEGTLGLISAGSGLTAAGLDTGPCLGGSGVACIGAGAGAISGGAGLLTGLGIVTGTAGAGPTALGVPTGGLGFLGDLGNALLPSSASGATRTEGCG
jgi:hypothetical protein